VGKSDSVFVTSGADREGVSQPAVFKRIVACLSSALELPVVEGAARMFARRRRSRVLVVHVATNPLTAEIFPELTVRRDIESPLEANALVEEAVRGLKMSGVSASGMVLREPTARTSDLIVRAAADFSADLVVMCSRGLTDLRSLLEGSVSHQVLSKGPCPILCLPGGLPRFRLRRIVVGWDGSPAATAALSLAVRMSRVHDASLEAIHVGHDGSKPERSRLRGNASFAELDEGPDGVADTLNEAAHKARADLVVIGSHGRGDLTAMVLGSVTHRLLAISERPILVVRERRRRSQNVRR
jgi:nucleotide-binding universal stress UspA family protein